MKNKCILFVKLASLSDILGAFSLVALNRMQAAQVNVNTVCPIISAVALLTLTLHFKGKSMDSR